MGKQTVAVDTPLTQWKIPPHVLARADKPDPDQLRRAQDIRCAHSMMLSAQGNVHPLVITGYHAEPQLPVEFMAETAGAELKVAAYADWRAEHPLASQVDIRSTTGDGHPFNPFGSLLAVEFGAEIEPLYGSVFFCRVSDAAGVISKLSIEVKDMLMFKLVTLQSVIEGVRPDFMSEEQYLWVWQRLRALVVEHRRRVGLDTPTPAPE